MYESYWKLQRPPFHGAPDVSSFCATRTHQGALLKLRYLVEHRLGAGVLTGAHGLGKTFLTHVLEADIAPSAGPLARLVFPQMSPAELLAYLSAKLGAEPGHPQDTLRTDRVLAVLEHRLTRLAAEGRHPILVIDEAQLLVPEQFQVLHLLLNISTEARSHFSLILVGEPDLIPRLQRNGAFDERFAVRTTLRPLSAEETGQYVASRLAHAGQPEPVFTAEALAVLWELSQGIPRRINQLCDLSLLVGFADRLTSISPVEIEAAAEELLTVAVE
ncbi:MAG: AAA family ATPase [Planctomyces sp.]|nr:AAA family ATPase [Planctomyces sp.]